MSLTRDFAFYDGSPSNLGKLFSRHFAERINSTEDANKLARELFSKQIATLTEVRGIVRQYSPSLFVEPMHFGRPTFCKEPTIKSSNLIDEISIFRIKNSNGNSFTEDLIDDLMQIVWHETFGFSWDEELKVYVGKTIQSVMGSDGDAISQFATILIEPIYLEKFDLENYEGRKLLKNGEEYFYKFVVEPIDKQLHFEGFPAPIDLYRVVGVYDNFDCKKTRYEVL